MLLHSDYSLPYLEQGKRRWQERETEPFSADFVRLDLTKYDIKSKIPRTFDSAFSFARVEHAFLDDQRATNFVDNVARSLKPGGIFFGYTLDTGVIWKKTIGGWAASYAKALARRSKTISVPAGACWINFPMDRHPQEHTAPKLQKYGTKYWVNLPDGTLVTQFLIHLPTLIELAATAGLRCLSVSNFQDFFQDHRMAFGDRLAQYGLSSDLTDSQLQSAGLYTTFVFEKAHSTQANSVSKHTPTQSKNTSRSPSAGAFTAARFARVVPLELPSEHLNKPKIPAA